MGAIDGEDLHGRDPWYKLEGFLGEDVPWIETISAGDGQEFPVGLP